MIVFANLVLLTIMCICNRLAFQIGFYPKVAHAWVLQKCGIQLPMPLGLSTVIISVLAACSPYLHCLPQRPRLPFCECWRVHRMFIWVAPSESTSWTEGAGIVFDTRILPPWLSKFLPIWILIHCWNRFHLRWGCRELLYDKSADGSIYVTGLSMSKVIFVFLFEIFTYLVRIQVTLSKIFIVNTL